MQVVDHYEKPRNVGSFDKTDPSVGTGLVGAPACGDVMKLQIKVQSSINAVFGRLVACRHSHIKSAVIFLARIWS